MQNNMKLWNGWAEVPANAQKEIKAGRLRGMTDINPMWRYKVLTEKFGAAGVGWKTEDEKYTLANGANDEIVVICTLRLRYVDPVTGEWSDGVFGVGGSTFVALEKNGLYTSDEAHKMAHTDAISVACKQLGIGANVYWASGRSKYADKPIQVNQTDDDPLGKNPGHAIVPQCAECSEDISVKVHDYSVGKFGKPLCMKCQKGQK